MKIVKLLIVIILVSLTTSSYASKISISNELKTALQKQALDPFLGELVRTVSARLPMYEKWFVEASKVPDGVTIDVILQMHDFVGQNPAEHPMVIQSQNRIAAILRKGNYDVIGGEGYDLDRVTEKALMDLAIEELHRDGIMITREQVQQGFSETIKYDAVLLYMKEYPAALVFGYEDMPLNNLHNRTLDQLSVSALKRYMELDQFSIQLAKLRSKIAIAKTIIKLKKTSKKRGVIVIGLHHEPEMRMILQSLKIKGEIYNTAH